MTLPVLYSLRNCPYAMRARIAIFKSQQPVALRDVVLTNKPAEMILASAKATVPILVFNASKTLSVEGCTDSATHVSNTDNAALVIDESLDIMLWALHTSDPHDLLHNFQPDMQKQMLALINDFDIEFKRRLEAYKCAKRYHETNLVECRQACEEYILRLDIALLPFIRQFARIERQWYLQSPYPKVKQWLTNYLQSPMFTKVMAKYPLWHEGCDDVIFVGK